eukprot:gnl/TRDRNA2_/TRDRNA2_44149_c0_seq1.p1 gnl/TRDRNA2_/TRDRNA2_44149_c0~~gnl/TRDRNA2_/TRDRNA2_44149_c0_seq1.p1  ORF type:complete len:211 (-),score=33.63 gnl/TRDRNA2_/TRDRNA2_44149_c0_seq1:65-697(-)
MGSEAQNQSSLSKDWHRERRILLTGDFNRLVDMVDALVADSEPWCAKQTVETILQHLISEVDEVKNEVTALKSADSQAGPRDHQTAKLAGELGDVLFCTLLSIAISARDHGVDPSRIYDLACAKLERRAAYFFAAANTTVLTLEDANEYWRCAKLQEKEEQEPRQQGRRPLWSCAWNYSDGKMAALTISALTALLPFLWYKFGSRRLRSS